MDFFVWLYFNYSTFLYTDFCCYCCCWIELFSLHNLNILWYSFTEIINITFQLLRSTVYFCLRVFRIYKSNYILQIQITDIMRTLTEACTVTIAIHEITLDVCLSSAICIVSVLDQLFNCISVFLSYTAKYLNQEYFKELSKFLRFFLNLNIIHMNFDFFAIRV